jgi:hypothetical protein
MPGPGWVLLFKSFWSRPDLTRDVIQGIPRAQEDRRNALTPGSHPHHGQPFYTANIATR